MTLPLTVLPAPQPFADLSVVDPRAVALLGERWARKHQVLPVALDGSVLIVATADPLDLDAEREVSFATGHRVRWLTASAEVLAAQIERWYPDTVARRLPALPPVEVQHLVFGAESGGDSAADAGSSAIRLVDQLLAEGIAAGASDIHIETEERGIAVRHRIDGVLRQVHTLPRSLAPSLVSRVKILSALNIADRLRPQDGRARVAVAGAVVDLRVSTLPASHGEKVVIRVLDGSAGLRTLGAIGFDAGALARIRTLLEQREGLILVTGPTGSGKTTTLYAALREVQARGVNIVTVEDPIEYRLPGIVQVQVHEKAGLTFSAALRSIMRQDPDVILVGEIRDRATAEIAIQASLTGHLVLSTLHTNDAASAITRLVDIGVPSYQIATALKGVVAQRLLRRRCAECASAGCPACDGVGYRGRLAVAEILVSTPDVERIISAGGSAESIAGSARTSGCISLWQAGLALVQHGETTMEELRRVAAAPQRVVAEPGREIPRADGVARIAVVVGEEHHALFAALGDAAEPLAHRVHVVAVADASAVADPADPCDVGVVPFALLGDNRAPARQSATLLVVVGVPRAPADQLQLLAHRADLLLGSDVPARVVLATILALLRWRG